MAKSPQAVCAMLACLRAGHAYVPIDPFAPMPRRRAVLAASGAAALVVDEARAGEWQGDAALAEVSVLSPTPVAGAQASSDPWAASDPPVLVPPAEVGPDQLAYVLYTSGSTGAPKGVEITHANAAAFVLWALDAFDVGPSDHVAVHAPLHFDLPVFDVFVGLAVGATLCLVDERTARFPAALARFLLDQRVTVLYAVPTAYAALLQEDRLPLAGLRHLRLALSAGEELLPTTLRRLVGAAPQARVHNLYGPVETNVVTAHRVTAADLHRPRIPIGRPVDHAQVFLLGEDGQVVEGPGAEGEIVVSGASVSPGYLGDAALTARTRVEVVAPGGEVRACYRTGDFGRWDGDGSLHFLGRRDGLVKIRGFRVEVGDVEATLARHPGLAEVVVVPVCRSDRSRALQALVVPRPGAEVEVADVLRWCRAELPPYMVPAAVAVREELPRTSTGKVDRAGLRAELDADLVAVGGS